MKFSALSYVAATAPLLTSLVQLQLLIPNNIIVEAKPSNEYQVVFQPLQQQQHLAGSSNNVNYYYQGKLQEMLLDQINTSNEIGDFYAQTNYKRLIKTSAHRKPRWMTEDDIHTLRRMGVKFMDVTEAYISKHLASSNQGSDISSKDIFSIEDIDIDDNQSLMIHEHSSSSAKEIATKDLPKLPTQLIYQDTVKPIVSNLTTSYMEDTLKRFTEFHNRYYDSSYGLQSSEWLLKRIQSLIDEYTSSSTSSPTKVTVKHFKHKFKQPSIIARFEGQPHTSSSSNNNKKVADETVIISAHQDSVNMWIPWFGRAPGADDDGSGTVTILEAFRTLLVQLQQGNFRPQRTVEFHWYAGEEGGLLGSQDVAHYYRRHDRTVVGQLHFDMTGYNKRPKNKDEIIGVVVDNTDIELSNLLRLLAKTYSRLETRDLECGYACSDHASWNQVGYRSAMAYECDDLEANSNIHSPKDVVETVDFNHMVEFTKLAIGYAYEVGNAI
ncbi:hypothetical protein H4219_006071 [Mycoemilia scoparia]|uniref:Peptide hydrolase n=1 Tax=Mycoemilia scoparia TaxID=417184 RepID=A0A9W7ZT90_9FUNG|nr:hypothetical protein H4219_006071 [Mycoemilia scoparia]